MEDDAPVIYGLEFQARALAPRSGETDKIQFIVGSQSLRSENQIHLIDFDDDHNLINKNVFLHRDGEIWQVAASPKHRDLISTVYNKTLADKAEMHAAFWRIPELTEHSDDSSTAPSLELVTRLDKLDYGDMKSILWHPLGDNDNIIALADNKILVFDLNTDNESAVLQNSTSLEGKGQPKFTSGAWNPHHNCTQVATAHDSHIKGWDLRSMDVAWQIENAHGSLVRDLDFNPNKQYHIASCGDDNKAKFWDFRNPGEPVKILADHSHWVWSIRFNHFHDQLVLTSSSDSRVLLTNISSISSEPFDDLIETSDKEESGDETMVKERPTDGIIATYDEHEDSVYKAEWSTADPWVFASLSYDGRLVVNRVPRAEKYKILL